MQVSLVAIKFNHDPDSVAADALNIRRNETETVVVPEWRRGLSVLPDDSPAAYAIKAIGKHPITIKAKFSCVNPKIRSVEVRAIDPAKGNAIGEVAPREITFNASGETDFESFDLINVDIQNRGVSSSITTFVWQCRVGPSDTWSYLTTTCHRIYTLLDVPNCAWRQQPFEARNVQLPWTEVLDYACQWASGAKELDEAAGRITQAVFDLGQSLVGYDGPPTYADLTFDCASLLSLFHDDKGMGQRFNCSDCATIVSTFANALGCDLWQSRIGTGSFTTNPIHLIGSSSFKQKDFEFHEVAWKDDCSFKNDLFDACLELDADEDPSKPPETGVLAIQTIFGTTAKGSYRFRLAPSPKYGAEDICVPTPEKRKRRAIGLTSPEQIDCTTITPLGAGNQQHSGEPELLSGNVTIKRWELYRVRFLNRSNLVFGAFSLWFLPEGDPEQLIRLDYYEFKTAEEAAREKQRLLDRYQVRDKSQDMNQRIAAIDIIVVTNTAFLGQIGFVVFEARSIGRKEIDVEEFKQIVSEILSNESHS